MVSDTLGPMRLYVIWFLFPSFSIFPISYLFMISLFFSEKCLCPFIHLDYLCFLQWVIWALYGFWILALVSDIKLKVFSSFCTLSLHYFNCFLCCTESWVQLNPRLSLFVFVVCAFEVFSEQSLPKPRLWTISTVFFQ